MNSTNTLQKLYRLAIINQFILACLGVKHDGVHDMSVMAQELIQSARLTKYDINTDVKIILNK